MSGLSEICWFYLLGKWRRENKVLCVVRVQFVSELSWTLCASSVESKVSYNCLFILLTFLFQYIAITLKSAGHLASTCFTQAGVDSLGLISSDSDNGEVDGKTTSSPPKKKSKKNKSEKKKKEKHLKTHHRHCSSENVVGYSFIKMHWNGNIEHWYNRSSFFLISETAWSW